MKTVLLSTQSKWCCKIGNREKLIEVRKSAPKEIPFKVLLYCTKTSDEFYPYIREEITDSAHGYLANGKIIGEFICDKVEKFYCVYVPFLKENNLGYGKYLNNGVYKVNGEHDGIAFERDDIYIDSMLKNSDLKKMCLSAQELYDYVGVGRNLFAWHISNLKIYDEPKELSEFGITRAPQSWVYVKGDNNGKE